VRKKVEFKTGKAKTGKLTRKARKTLIHDHLRAEARIIFFIYWYASGWGFKEIFMQKDVSEDDWNKVETEVFRRNKTPKGKVEKPAMGR
jgi:activator of 2-hydroxyglutaryl-CoA dehydratase